MRTLAVNTLYTGARRLAGRALELSGRALRRASNRLTTFGIRQKYFSGCRQQPYTLSGMLSQLQPRDFGPRDETLFVAPPNCRDVAEAFVAKNFRQLTPIEWRKFRNGETYARSEDNVRNKRVVVFQAFQTNNLNDSLITTLLLIDSLKRASAKAVVLVCPELPYLKTPAGSPNYEIDSFKLVLNLLFKAVGLDELRLGNVVLNRESSLLIAQDIILSREAAPLMMVHGEKLRQSSFERAEPGLAFITGRRFRQVATEIIGRLTANHDLGGSMIDLDLTETKAGGQINIGSRSYIRLKGKTAYLFQTCNTGRINDDFMEALLMVYVARKAGAKEVVLVMPHLPYNRQERKAKPHEPISAKVVARALVEAAGATRLIPLDLHAPATEGLVDVPLQHITAQHLIVEFVKTKMAHLLDKLVPAAPDVGRGKAVRKFGREAIGPNAKFAIVDKDRPQPGISQVAAVVGRVRNKVVFVYDDMIDSGGTIINAAKALIAAGAKQVYVATIHPVFSDVEIKLVEADGGENQAGQNELEQIRRLLADHGKAEAEYLHFNSDRTAFTVNALVRLQANPEIAGLVFTNSISVNENDIIDQEKVNIISIAPLLSAVCSRIIQGESLVDIQYQG